MGYQHFPFAFYFGRNHFSARLFYTANSSNGDNLLSAMLQAIVNLIFEYGFTGVQYGNQKKKSVVHTEYSVNADVVRAQLSRNWLLRTLAMGVVHLMVHYQAL